MSLGRIMSFSFTRIILDKTEKVVYDRGLDYAKKGKVKLTTIGNNFCKGKAFGQEQYDVELGFKRTGSPKFYCSCQYYALNKLACKHIIALALVWDRSRNVPDPDLKTIQQLAIPEPDFSSKDINLAYKDPINANLEVLRADPTGWMRPHARLPEKPSTCNSNEFNVENIKKALSEIRAWSRKYNYDYYFCAGEMIAGYCELIRWIMPNVDALPEDDLIKVLELLVDFHLELIMEKIDDSDGLHVFNEAHLFKIFELAEESRRLKIKSLENLKQLKNKITDY